VVIVICHPVPVSALPQASKPGPRARIPVVQDVFVRLVDAYSSCVVTESLILQLYRRTEILSAE